MTSVNAPMTEEARVGIARVEMWIDAHPDLWRQWNESWRDATGHTLHIAGSSSASSALMAAIVGGGQTFATLGSTYGDDRCQQLLRAIADLIGDALAMETELNTMTDELVDSYDQLTFLYEIAHLLSRTSTLEEALTARPGAADYRRKWQRVGN